MKKRPLCIASIIYIIGILIGLYCERSMALYDGIYQDLTKQNEQQNELKIEAIVVSPKQEKEYTNTYEIEIKNINGNTKYKRKKINT